MYEAIDMIITTKWYKMELETQTYLLQNQRSENVQIPKCQGAA